MPRFTDKFIRALKPSAERYDHFDADRSGLGVRVFPTGRKSFFFRYRSGERRIRMALGWYPELSLADAREQVAEYRKLLVPLQR